MNCAEKVNSFDSRAHCGSSVMYNYLRFAVYIKQGRSLESWEGIHTGMFSERRYRAFLKGILEMGKSIEKTTLQRIHINFRS